MTATDIKTPDVEVATEAWAVDAAHTQAGFAVRHLMIANVKGRFTDLEGTVRYERHSNDATVDVAISAASITTGDARRDEHLRSADFFDADRYPKLQFRGGRLDGNPDSKFALYGELTIRGVTKPVTLYVVNEGRAKDPWGAERVGYTATATINRKDFGLEWNMALEAGGVLVGDEVRITIETELVRQS
jgi:polyisoprenoid-binding protein YceI